MDRIHYFVTVFLLCASPLWAQHGSPTTAQQESFPSDKKSAQAPVRYKYGPIDVVSETNGADLRPYLPKVLRSIKANWYSRVPDAAYIPVSKKGVVVVSFKVMKDGTISSLQYARHSGDDALDSAAYEGVASSSPLPALPSEFGCEFVALRIRFFYNPGPDDAKTDDENTSARIPCVTTALHFTGEVGIALSPDASRVVAGDKQQFIATVIGVENPGIIWKVAGLGCDGSACGEISTDGLYRAPSDIPNPPTVTITATLRGASDQTASATVTIFHRTGSQ